MAHASPSPALPRLLARLPAALLCLTAALCLGLPSLAVTIRTAQGLLAPDGWSRAADAAALDHHAWQRLALTLGIALLIGVLASVLALGPACLLARAGRLRTPLAAIIAAPALLPPYLAYAGWGLIRAPLSPGARWLEEAAATWLPDAPILAGRILAILGLALWSWPVGVLVAAPMLARLDRALLEEARLSLPPLSRLALRARLALPALLTSTAVVGLLMLGSAVPLHLAQIETDAIRLWRLLDQTSPADRWTAWAGAWPTILLALLAAAMAARTLAHRATHDSARPVGTERPPPRRIATPILLTALLGGLSVGVPLLLFALSIRDAQSLARFWTLHADALRHSAALASVVGLLAALLGAAFAYTIGAAQLAHPRRAARTTLLLAPFLAGAILPGVLLGSATLEAWSALAALPGLHHLTDSPAIVVATHLARFGGLAAIIGLALAATEPAELIAARAIHGATGPLAWARTRPPAAWAALLGLGLATALLSLHEIESAVIVQPVGMQSLSRHLLSLLHFARDEELSAAAVWIIALGVIPATLAILAILAGARPGRRSGQAPLGAPETITKDEPTPHPRR